MTLLLWFFLPLALLIAGDLYLTSKYGKWAAYLMLSAWCFSWEIYQIVTGDFWWNRISNLLLGLFWFWMFWKNRPKGKWKGLKKAVSERIRQLIGAMTAFVKVGTKPAFS